MFQYSFSTVLMAVLASNLIIITISLCFRHKKIMLSVGYKLLIVFLALTLVRFVFPLQFANAKNVILPEWLSILISYFRYNFINQYGILVSLWTVFECVWLFGIVFKLFRYFRECAVYKRYISMLSEDVTEEEPYKTILSEVCGQRKNGFRVLKMPQISSPCLYRIFKPCILLPAELTLSDKDLYYTFRHETSHHYHHDLVIKRIVGFFSVLYWWNPACHVLRSQVDVLLEMRVDDTLVQGDPSVAREYLTTLIHIAENSDSNSDAPVGVLVSLTRQNSGALVRRFEMVCDEKPHRNVILSALLVAIVFFMYLGSYLFIFENFYAVESNVEGTIENIYLVYAVLKADGTYDIYYGEYFMENVESLAHYRDVPVYNEPQ